MSLGKNPAGQSEKRRSQRMSKVGSLTGQPLPDGLVFNMKRDKKYLCLYFVFTCYMFLLLF